MDEDVSEDCKGECCVEPEEPQTYEDVKEFKMELYNWIDENIKHIKSLYPKITINGKTFECSEDKLAYGQILFKLGVPVVSGYEIIRTTSWGDKSKIVVGEYVTIRGGESFNISHPTIKHENL